MKLVLDSVKDDASWECFAEIQREFNSRPILLGDWKFFQISVTGAVTDYKFKHNLGFIPKDIIQTAVIGGPITWSYSKFDIDYVYLSTTGSCTFRGFIGLFRENRIP